MLNIVIFCLFSYLCCTSRAFSETSKNSRRFFATTTKGAEPILVKELEKLSNDYKLTKIRSGKCGVHFIGDDAAGFAACMHIRTALKVMEVIADGSNICNRNDLYELCASVSYTDMIHPDATLCCDAVIGVCEDRDLSHSHFSALTMKNAVVDQFQNKFGRRPSVDKEYPYLPLFLYLHRRKATVYRVWSGVMSMHKRGYRGDIHKAALRETTAATLLLASGWKAGETTLCDPLCGSGTIAIEAALMASNTAPGLIRCGNQESGEPPSVAWGDIDPAKWDKVWIDAEAADQRHVMNKARGEPRIMVNDINRSALELAIRGAGLAGVHRMISFQNKDVCDYTPMCKPDMVVTNPPWDVRFWTWSSK